MKRHQPGNAGVPCERARLRGGEMAPCGGKLGVFVQECRLDEELVGAARELGNACDVRCMESGVDHVGDSVSARAAQRMLLEHAEGDGEIVADENWAVVGRPAPDRSLGFVQPGTDRKLQQIEARSPPVDPSFLLEGEGQAGRSVIEDDALDAKLLFVQQLSLIHI